MGKNTQLVNYTFQTNIIIIWVNKSLTGLHLNQYSKAEITSSMFVLEFSKIITFIVKIASGVAWVFWCQTLKNVHPKKSVLLK